jgi:hypothetical protein
MPARESTDGGTEMPDTSPRTTVEAFDEQFIEQKLHAEATTTTVCFDAIRWQ